MADSHGVLADSEHVKRAPPLEDPSISWLVSHRQFVLVRRLHRRRRQREIERRTAIYQAFRPNAAAVPADRPSHRGEPNARPLELFLAMQALEHAEQFSNVAHVEADAVVAHVEHDTASLVRLAADFDFGACSRPREFQCIREQVCEDKAKHIRVAGNDG